MDKIKPIPFSFKERFYRFVLFNAFKFEIIGRLYFAIYGIDKHIRYTFENGYCSVLAKVIHENENINIYIGYNRVHYHVYCESAKYVYDINGKQNKLDFYKSLNISNDLQIIKKRTLNTPDYFNNYRYLACLIYTQLKNDNMFG